MDDDATIARMAALRPIVDVAADAGIPEEALISYGKYKAKVASGFLSSIGDRDDGKLILVTAISPTPLGEGKTTVAIGLDDALNKIGRQTLLCLREPSLGPCFGLKGGATGGGYTQIAPMEDINLHFTGDFHAVSSAHNLLSAMIDNHYYWSKKPADRIVWRRALDMNDRTLRKLQTTMGETGFDITPASEVMAILCLATSLADLKERLARVIVGFRQDGSPLYAHDFGAHESMSVLLRDAFQPNLVQTLENHPVFVHGGPFGNISHGCNSLQATQTALKLADYVVTEAGFGADLGAEKFLNITCRTGKLKPVAAVVVASVRALKVQGGVDSRDIAKEDAEAVARGCENLKRHLENIDRFGIKCVVAINRFDQDTDAESQAIADICQTLNVKVVECNSFRQGGDGAIELAREVAALANSNSSHFRYLYDDTEPLVTKIERVASDIYGAGEVEYTQTARDELAQFEGAFSHLPICMAKTPYSFSTDPGAIGAPTGHTVHVGSVSIANGAGYVVVNCGNIIKMPGLPREPAATRISLDTDGTIRGLS